MLGVYVGPGDLEEANWRPRITAVENVFASWRQRALSFRGRALVIGSLTLSRIWYVASLVHMPLWVHAELAKLIFRFSGSGSGYPISHCWWFLCGRYKVKGCFPAGSVDASSPSG